MKPARCQDKTSRDIRGQVRTGNGEPLPADVTVRLEEAEGVVAGQQFVGNDGKFSFDNLTGELYRLVVTAKGYETVRQDVDMHFLASRYPTLYLVPAGQKQVKPSSAAVTATDAAASKKARNEYEKGHIALQAGRLDEARKRLEKAVAEYPCYARAQAALGVTLGQEQSMPPAESALRKSLECDPAFLEAYIELGILLSVEGKFAESENVLSRGLEHFPGEWQLHYQLGLAHRGTKRYEEAETEYSRVESMKPANLPPEFHLRLADVCLQRQEFAKAYAELETYLHVAPNGPLAAETKDLMQRILKSGVLFTARRPAQQQPQ